MRKDLKQSPTLPPQNPAEDVYKREDMNMFQSGHRRYGQKKGDGDTSVTGLEEDNWRYVEDALSMTCLLYTSRCV